MALWQPDNKLIGDVAEEEFLSAWRPTKSRWEPSPIDISQTVAVPEEQRSVRQPMQRTFEPSVEELQQIALGQPAKEEKVSVPFWQRALELFAAPFEWIDETIIKPTLGVVGTAVGAVEEVKRMAGEDYWEWKKRSWEELETPGIKINVPWSDEPWTVDIKGVIEFAPWLLIPGAGQVGTAAKVGRGLAGVVGRAGKIGKVLGTAIEYSPWGMVEKTVGKAIKVGVKGVSGASERFGTGVGEKLFGKYKQPPTAPIVQKLTKFFDEQVLPARKAFEKELPKLRATQEAKTDAIWKQVREGKLTLTEALEKAKAARGGALKPEFAVEIGKFTEDEVDELTKMIVNKSETGLMTTDSANAFRLLMITGELPQPHHIQAFAKVFGRDFANAVSNFSKLSQSGVDTAIDVLNISRPILSSMDISGMLRQGLILGLTHPTKVPATFWKMMKAVFSEKLSLEMDDLLRAKPYYDDFVRLGGYVAPIEKTARASVREEAFISGLAEKVPGVRRSERAFITYLNELRYAAFEDGYKVLTAQGADEATQKLFARFINLASGRGDLPKALDKYAPAINAILFSPRLQASRLELPRQIYRMLINKNPYVRKEAAKALVTFVGGGVSLLTLLKQSGVADVELDPRSSDFGKIKIGETRYDIWTGYLQYIRFAAQIMTGEKKTAYGNMNKADRLREAFRFLQSKGSPAFGLVVDLASGERYMGEPTLGGTTETLDTIKSKFFPLAVQDIIDAMEKYGGMNGLFTAAPAIAGVGVLTYVNDLVLARDKIARQMGYSMWDDIDPKTQRMVEDTTPELQAAMIQFDRQSMGTAWGDWNAAGQAIEDEFKNRIIEDVAWYRNNPDDGYGFRQKISLTFAERKGAYTAREANPVFEDIVKRQNTEDTLEALVNLGPERLAIKIYNDALYNDDMYDEFGDYRFDKADAIKEQLKNQLGGLYDYAEGYAESKYDILPVEFQELQKAKKVMSEYWDVQSQVEAIWGKPTTPQAKKRIDAVVQRMRKRLRRLNPEIAYYYDMFYKQG